MEYKFPKTNIKKGLKNKTTVIVVTSTSVIASVAPLAGSVALGYVWLVAWESASQLNVNDPETICTVLEVVSEWLPIVNTNVPRVGL